MKSVNEASFFGALGKRISELRAEKSMTQEALAEATGLDRVAIAYIETGKRKPKVSSIYKIAVALKMSVEDIFKDL